MLRKKPGKLPYLINHSPAFIEKPNLPAVPPPLLR
jgi:hypothetical protein